MQTQATIDGSMNPVECPDTLITRGGVVMKVRPVLPADGPILKALFEHVTPNDLRFRFLSSMRQVDAGRIADMVDVDHQTRETFLAFDAEKPIATAMLAAEPGQTDAEVAISVRSDMKGRGVGWTLLQHVIRYAKARGFQTIHSIENRSNRNTIDLERDAGFHVEGCEGDPSDVVVTKSLADPR